MIWNDVATVVFLVPGAVLAITGSIGVVRMPDFYTRLHPAGKSDTLAQGLILCGLAFQASDWVLASKVLMLVLLLFVTAPTATHAITKAAQLDDLRPWTPPAAPNSEPAKVPPAETGAGHG